MAGHHRRAPPRHATEFHLTRRVSPAAADFGHLLTDRRPSRADFGIAALAMLAVATLASVAVSPPPLPKTWGFNYDRTYPVTTAGGEGDSCQMNLADIMALPGDGAMQAAVDKHLHADFAAMKSMGGTAVRLYASLDSILTSPTAVNATALAALAHIVDVAAAEGLLVDLTGESVSPTAFIQTHRIISTQRVEQERT
jgi:hypothetical protein